MSEVKSKYRAFLDSLAATLEMPKTQITPETRLDSTGLWDSMAIVVTMGYLDEIEISIETDKLGACETVQDVLTLAGLAP